MKNYCFNIFDKNEFVTFFEVKKDKIIIHLANGEKRWILNTPENHQKLLEKMRCQLDAANEAGIINLCNREIQKLKEELKIFSIIGIIALGGSIVINGGFIIIGGIVVSLSILVSLSSGKKLKEVLDIKEDFQKYKLFVEKEEAFTDKNKINEYSLEKVSKKGKKQIKDSTKREPLNLNSINNISEDDLKRLYAGISFNEHMGFDYKEDRGVQRTRKKKN